MITLTPRCVLLLGSGLVPAALPVLVDERLWVVWLAWLACGLLAIGLDFILVPPPRRIIARIEAPESLFIGDRDELRFELLGHGGALGSRVELLFDLNDILETQPVLTGRLDPDRVFSGVLPLVPQRRGEAEIHALWMRWCGPLGLVRRQSRQHLERRIPVAPNTRSVRRMALRFFRSREYLAGLKVERYLGDGTEFESLREYTSGMDHRRMNWKASARHRTLLCQQFRAERDHQVVFAVDCGHLMSEPLDGIPRLDHAVNALLSLSYICLRTGDRVGFYAFDEQPRAWSPPQRGVHGFPRIEKLAAALEYRAVETNFTLGMVELARQLRRRSLVIVLTDFVDSVTAELMVRYTRFLSRSHLVLFVALRDPELAAIVDSVPRELGGLHRAVAATELLGERQGVLRRLQRGGIQVLDAPPAALGVQMINRYLDIKRREQI